MAEPHCSAAHGQEQTCIIGKAVAPDSHLLQLGTLPAYTTVQIFPVVFLIFTAYFSAYLYVRLA